MRLARGMQSSALVRVLELTERVAAVAALVAAACGGGAGADPEVSQVDAASPRTCNLDPRGRVVAELDRMREAFIAYYEANGGFPVALMANTPEASCCAQNLGGLGCCYPTASDWDTAAWRELGFAQSEPHEFQFAYTGVVDGATLTMTATGDLDCDGTTLTYSLSCTSGSGAPACTVTAPINED